MSKEFLADAARMNAAMMPNRRFQLTLTIGADSKEVLVGNLLELAREVDKGTKISTMGGSDSNWTLTVKEDPEMTHEKYSKALDAYLHRELHPDLEDMGKNDSLGG